MENNDLPAVYNLQYAQQLLTALPPSTLNITQQYLKAKVLAFSNHPSEALATISGITANRNDLPRLQELEADCYLKRFEIAPPGMAAKDDLHKAENLYEWIHQHVEKYDNMGWVHYQLGRCYLFLDRVDGAAQFFRGSLTLPTVLPDLKALTYERLGYIEFYHHRNFKQALSMLNLAVALYPANANSQWLIQTHLFRSRVMQSIGQYEQATQTIIYVIDYAKKTQHANLLRDVLLAASELISEINGNEEQALSYLGEYIDLSPVPAGHNITWSRVQEMMGNLHYKLRHYIQAAQCYQKAINSNPNHPWQVSIYYRLAQCYYQQGNYQSVIDTVLHLMQIVTSDGQALTDFRVYDILGSAYFATEKYRMAADAYQKALEYIPDTSENLEKIRLYYHFSLQLMNEA